jgi:hypothetical protein
VRLLAAFVLAGVLAGTALAAPGDPKRKHTPADMKLAQRALLTRADLGSGWTERPAVAAKPTSFACTSFRPDQSDLVETGAATSNSFVNGAEQRFLQQVSYVFKTEQQAATLWKRAIGTGLLRCLGESVRNGSTQTVTFTVRRTSRLTLPDVADRTAGFRVIATASSPGQKLGTYYDMIVLARGKVVTAISFAAFAESVPRSVELALARLVARRLPAGSPKA